MLETLVSDYFLSTRGWDITFCGAKCANNKCNRNFNSDNYKAMHKHIEKYNGFYSMSDFTNVCKSFMEE